MSQPDYDFADTLKAKSDQLNADDLMGGPITVQIMGAKQGDSLEQPLWLRISGGHQPWKPCKTMRRLLALAVGTSSSLLVGRWVTLYRDPEVLWGGKKEGGVRMSHLSGIDRPVEARLQVSKGKKASFRVQPLRDPAQQGAPTADLSRVIEDAGLTVEALDAYLVGIGKPPVAGLDDTKRAGMAVWLANPANAAKVRPAAPTEDTTKGEE